MTAYDLFAAYVTTDDVDHVNAGPSEWRQADLLVRVVGFDEHGTALVRDVRTAKTRTADGYVPAGGPFRFAGIRRAADL